MQLPLAQLRQHHANDTDLLEILILIRTSFAYMDGRIDPPSSMHQLTIADITEACSSGEVWSLGDPIHACMMLQLRPDVLYLGKLAIKEQWRHKGLGKKMVEHAIRRAQHHKKPIVEIKVRIELTENQCFFESQGFNIVAAKAHTGYFRSTYVVMHRLV